MLGHTNNKINKPGCRMVAMSLALSLTRYGLVVNACNRCPSGRPNNIEHNIASRPNTLMQVIEAPRATRGATLWPNRLGSHNSPPSAIVLGILYIADAPRRLPQLNPSLSSTTISWRSPHLNLNSLRIYLNSLLTIQHASQACN